MLKHQRVVHVFLQRHVAHHTHRAETFRCFQRRAMQRLCRKRPRHHMPGKIIDAAIAYGFGMISDPGGFHRQRARSLKLDRDIVEHFVANDNDYNLIKAIQIYSDMTGTDCIAEGVDSEEKFDKLFALGVKNFQGYYLSRAVKEEELDRMVRMFS